MKNLDIAFLREALLKAIKTRQDIDDIEEALDAYVDAIINNLTQPQNTGQQ